MKDLQELQIFLNMNKEKVQELMDTGYQLVASPDSFFFIAVSGQRDPFTTCVGNPYHFFIKEEEIDSFFSGGNL